MSSATVTLTLTASGTAALSQRLPSGVYFAILLIPCAFLGRKKHSGGALLLRLFVFSALTAALCGCGDRVASTADLVPPHAVNFKVTGTATNLAGQVVTHAVTVPYLQP